MAARRVSGCAPGNGGGTAMTRRIIKVAGMTGMNRKQVKLTNGVANCLVRKHGMCLDCAIKFSVGFVWGQDRPEHNPMQIGPLCSAACSDSLVEFFEETLGSKGEEVTDPDELARLIPVPIDQNPCAHWRSPMDMMRQG